MFQRLGLQAKIILITLLLGLVVLATLIANGVMNYQTQYQKTATEEATKLLTLVQNKMNKKFDIGLTGAISVATNRQLVQAVKNGDKAAASDILAGISQTFKDHTNSKNVKIHIHTPDNHSFLRSWNTKNGDDLSAFRFGVEQVIKEKQPIEVLELGRTGLAIRGITPLFDGQTYVGSLEFIQGVGSIHKEFKKLNDHYLMLLNQEALSISTKAKDNTAVGSYVLASNDWFGADSVSFAQGLDLKELSKKGWLIHNQMLVTSKPIKDMRGKEVGMHIIAEPDSHLNGVLDGIKSEIIFQVLTVVIILLLMMGVILFSLNNMVIKPVKDLQRTFAQVIKNGDFSIRVKTDDSHNEVNLMAKDFNHLLKTLQNTIHAISETMQSIEKGELSHRVQTAANGDLATLKLAINQTADNLENTMLEMGRVLSEMSQAKFGVRVGDINAQGAFKDALSQLQQTATDLNSAISQINTVVTFMAQANFSHTITTQLQGDLNTLKQNINTTLDALNGGFNGFSNSLAKLSSGDLTAKVEGHFHGQLARLQDIINNSLSNVASMFTEIKITSQGALENVKHVTKGNFELNERTQNQAASIEETAASMEEITSTIQNSVANAKHANTLAENARVDAESGAEIMGRAKSAMHGIHEASAKISEITTLIDGIAFQTNLLALNAAVEAARAGEHGRGFAVVAGEVRNLAQKSADAAKDITTLIHETTQQIDAGTKLAEESSDMLNKINNRINEVSEVVKEIALAAEEQALGVGQINQAVSQMDQITQQNAALVDQIAGDTQRMNEQVTRMVDLTGSFTIDTHALSLDTTIKTGDFTFAKARRAHRGWRSHMSQLIHVGTKPENVEIATDSHSCELGKWLDSEGLKHQHLAEFGALIQIHQTLHAEIKRVILMVDGVEEDIADQEIEKIEGLSEQVIAAINALEKAAANG
ncbi:methyl-accepting chemotaxis protein [Thiosulfativibrio zosterae]|uniref:Methyl-accepting chemotaxis protein n=1 Tax=Thiosulfativibrio zosterae TaxID=2675053 RepID=A0A6F8PJS4_9GAMM|nr:methyl-accepting chemotaxis protein [Thiosulfativibrio zosterae]BBP42349.1 hypothetical protein THMIRHAT_00950 [Thiosulfativibrio zosterae]